jgi:hypothetical protein
MKKPFKRKKHNKQKSVSGYRHRVKIAKLILKILTVVWKIVLVISSIVQFIISIIQGHK